MGVGALIITFSNKRSPDFSSKTTSRGSSQTILAIIFIIAWIWRCILGIMDWHAIIKRQKADEEYMKYRESKN